MPYQATVLPVMIASPSDVQQYRTIARDVIHEWNYIHSTSRNAVLMPVGWETHSSPELGATAQELINDRVLEDCDLLVGVFWTRLGTPTGKEASGTVEEIKRHVAAGKPAMVYFSKAPASPETIDPVQYAALKEFRSWCESQGLVETFTNESDFQGKLRRQLQLALQKNPYLKDIMGQSVMNGALTSSSVQAAPIDPREELAASLTDEARTLLLEGCEDSTGTILHIGTLGGRFIQANEKTFFDPNDHRASARWEYALEQLVIAGLVTERGRKGEVFSMTEPGYQLAEFLRSK